MEIILGDDMFFSSTSLEVVLPLYLNHNEVFFPCEGWTDFASILNMWAYDLLKHSQCKTGKFSLPFMDGPYRLDVTKNEKSAEIQCINTRRSAVIEVTISCQYAELFELVRKASCSFGKILYRKGLHQGKYAPIYKQAIITAKALKVAIEDGYAGAELLSGRYKNGSF